MAMDSIPMKAMPMPSDACRIKSLREYEPCCIMHYLIMPCCFTSLL